MTKAEEQALKAYPECMVYNDLAMEYEDINGCYRIGFEVGYNQAAQDYIEYAQLWVNSGEVNIKSFKQFLKDRGYE